MNALYHTLPCRQQVEINVNSSERAGFYWEWELKASVPSNTMSLFYPIS